VEYGKRMSVVDLFDQNSDRRPKSTEGGIKVQNSGGEVIRLITNAKLAQGVPARAIYRQIEALMVSHGVDMSCGLAVSDFKIISYLIEGIFDRQGGDLGSHRTVLGQTLRMVFEGDEKWEDDTDELFGDLLGKL
jgi:hypothetical protein